jgi:predicted dehydrogenase
MDNSNRIAYNFEYDRRIRAGFIGCGGHAWRNVYPTFQYAPVDLVAVCDLDAGRAEAFARQFGARHACTSHAAMLEAHDLDAVFIVTNYDERGHPRAAALALDCLAAGCHVWMEKPPAASVAEVDALIAASRAAQRFVMVGFKKMFFPAIEKAKSLMSRPDFGAPASAAIRYPQSLPAEDGRGDDARMAGFLDHIVHPASILLYLMGKTHSVYFLRDAASGGVSASLRFESGAVGTMHLAAGQSGISPLERVEVVGRGANLVVENGVRLTYYRPGSVGEYGRVGNFTADDDSAALHFEPEFSLGQLYNKNLFLLGYAQEVRAFCDCVLRGEAPDRAGLEDAREILRLYEAFRGPDGVEVVL